MALSGVHCETVHDRKARPRLTTPRLTKSMPASDKEHARI